MPTRGFAIRPKMSGQNLYGSITTRTCRDCLPRPLKMETSISLSGPPSNARAPMPRGKREEPLDFHLAAAILETEWQTVTTEAAANPDLQYVIDDALRAEIYSCVNHHFVAHRFCLPIQLLGK